MRRVGLVIGSFLFSSTSTFAMPLGVRVNGVNGQTINVTKANKECPNFKGVWIGTCTMASKNPDEPSFPASFLIDQQQCAEFNFGIGPRFFVGHSSTWQSTGSGFFQSNSRTFEWNESNDVLKSTFGEDGTSDIDGFPRLTWTQSGSSEMMLSDGQLVFNMSGSITNGMGGTENSFSYSYHCLASKVNP